MDQFDEPDILFGSTFVNIENKNIFAQDFSVAGRTPGFVNFVQLLDLDIKYSMVGHLERRVNNIDSLNIVIEKIKLLRQHHIVPILCIGYYDRIEDNIEELDEILSSVNCNNLNIVIAYEHISSTMKGERLYSIDEIEYNINKLSNLLASKKEIYFNFQFSILFGGGVNEEVISKMPPIINGFLIGDRYTSVDSISSIYQNYQKYKQRCYSCRQF